MPLRRLSIPALGLAALVATAAPAYADRAAPDPAATSAANDSGIVLLQRPGNDVLVGERQTDTLSGGDGNDVLFGVRPATSSPAVTAPTAATAALLRMWSPAVRRLDGCPDPKRPTDQGVVTRSHVE